jgi:HD-GYP domain-containing protein (c-di-GMP phosphodiesterase class II)
MDPGHLGDLAREPSIDSVLTAVRDLLGMEISYTSRMDETYQVLEAVNGDRAAFGGVAPGASLPHELTYCSRILSGRLPNIMTDVQADDRTASMPITQMLGIGAFASVPLRFSDGRLYGTLCAASHEAQPDLGYRDVQFLHVLARLIADLLERTELEGKARAQEMEAAAAQALLAAVAARDSYTAEHSEAVVEHAVAVAQQLGLSSQETADLEKVARLHDIGKIATPDAILTKPGRLTDEEWVVMRRHPIESEHLIASVPGLGHLAPAIRAEHERWDGTGYPDGLAGEDIPLASRITLVCDAYHAMTSDRPYRRSMSPEDARAEIEAGHGTQFCPTAARALLAVLDAGV